MLVDHQKPTSPLILLENVIRIFDHHAKPKEVLYPHLTEADIRLENVRSCSLIVADHVLSNNPKKFTQILRLLRGAIIMDYNNFLGVGKDRVDWEIFEDLEYRLREQVLERIKGARLDISGLDSMKLLKKDLKFVNTKMGDVKVAIPWFPTTIKVSWIQLNPHLHGLIDASNRLGR